MHILVLSSWFPDPPNNGSKQRAFYLLRALAERHDVSLISFFNKHEPLYDQRLKTFCHLKGVVEKNEYKPDGAKAIAGFLSPAPRFLFSTYSPLMRRMIMSEWENEHYDAILALQISMGLYVNLGMRCKKVLDELEIGSFYNAANSLAHPMRKARSMLTWGKLRSFVRLLVQKFNICTAVSSNEINYLKKIAPAYPGFHLIPNGVDTNALHPAQHPSADKTIIYNGALTFGANLDAMQFFISQVWPLVKAHAPDAKLKITGSYAGVDVAFCRLPDVELTGYVDDIAAHVRSARVCVVPLRVGGGTRLKILEAMALGVPVVSTPKGAEGLDARHDEHVLLAGDPADFARKVLDILNDDELCRRITSQARRLVEQTYDWASIGADFARLVESAKVSV